MRKIIPILIILLLLLIPNPYPDIHGNTNIAYQWCSDGNSDVGEPSCSGALGKCIDDYMKANNLSDTDFLTYVWLNSGFQYEKLFPYNLLNLLKLSIIIIIIVGMFTSKFRGEEVSP